MTPRTVLLSIGAILWISGLFCILRAGDRGRRLGEAVLFFVLGLPFLIAGAYYSASSYPQDTPPRGAAPVGVPPAAEVPAAPPAPLPQESPPHAQAVLAAQRAAVARYPALGVAGSPFNAAFITAYRRLQRTEAYYFEEPDWPLRLADEVARDLAAQPPR